MSTAIATLESVSAACDAITAAGETPTIVRVRTHLGGGSPPTILQHIRTWREKQKQQPQQQEKQEKQQQPLPPAVNDRLTAALEATNGLAHSLWDIASATADARVTAEREALEARRAEIDAEISEFSAASAEIERERAAIAAERDELRRQLDAVTAERNALAVESRVLQARLDEKQANYNALLARIGSADDADDAEDGAPKPRRRGRRPRNAEAATVQDDGQHG